MKIGRPRNTCTQCGAPIADAGKHLSAIKTASGTSDQEGDEPIRQDFCSFCWANLQQREFYGFWMACREKPGIPKWQNRKARNSTILAYFDFLNQESNPENAEYLFFLSHLLMKYHVFQWVRTEPPADENGRERVIFRNTATDDEVAIEGVPLDEEHIAAIKKKVDEFLKRSIGGQEITV
ncbi:MAG: hypothetical protein WCK47_04450 [bacterium]